MDAFVKSFATYRTVKQATVLSKSLVVDSLDAEASTVTVVGTSISYSHTGDWLIIDGAVYQIKNVKPQTDRTVLTLISPIDAFSRPLEFEEQPEGQTIGGFVGQMLRTHWIECNDPVYSMPYLTVSDSDTNAFAVPELDDSGCFDLASYCRLMRKSYRSTVRFADAGKNLACTISKIPAASRQVSFEDGRSRLRNVDYSKSGAAKLTVLHDIDTGLKDSEGNTIMTRERSVWYLSESGDVSQDIPKHRATGEWSTITLKGDVDIEAKVIETFAKNKSSHKLEFWSTLDLAVQDDCTFLVYGESLHSYISYKRKSSGDNRYYYKSGELATTATEKMKGLIK